ncbi:MAG: glycogen debranching protein [Bacteroidota bacterium]
MKFKLRKVKLTILESQNWFFLFLLLASACQSDQSSNVKVSLLGYLEGQDRIEGKKAYLGSPYVTAGDRLYMVGHQDGSFPDLGWHVEGEMGGIWDHPIKLMDGFSLAVEKDEATFCLQKADRFANYPFANVHYYDEAVPGLKIQRMQFVPDGVEGIYVNYIIDNEEDRPINLKLTWNGMVDLRPVWLGERSHMKDGRDGASYDAEKQVIVAKDSLNDWYVVYGSSQARAEARMGSESCNFQRKGQGTNAALVYQLEIPAQGRGELPIVIAGSYASEKKARANFDKIKDKAPDLLLAKKKRYEEISQLAKITIPDKELQQAYEWTKYNTEWLIREVPEQGRAYSAGIPDYPWWFGCDNTYTLRGALASGQRDMVFSSLDLLKKLSIKTNGNGRVIHEASSNGVVFNEGNVNETPHFISTVWKVYEWTGDQDFLKAYFPFIQQGLQWLESQDADGNLCPDGFGMMEIHGLNSEMIDVAVYVQQAYQDASFMAQELDKEALAQEYQKKADQLRKLINTDFWVEDFNSYADFIGTTDQAKELIEGAIIRADTLGKPWAVEELENTKEKIGKYAGSKKQGFVLYHNWVVNTPLEMGIADSDKAQAALETGRQFVNPFGVFVTGIDRDESAGKDDGSFAEGKKIFSYVGAVMTLPTGVQAIAENNYGNPDKALDYLKRMTRSFSYALPGSTYEVSPDFGMMTQAWNLYSLAYPIVQQFFGIRPQAYQKEIHIYPQMPRAWEEAKLENLPIGDNQISMTYRKKDNFLHLDFKQKEGDWEIILHFPKDSYQQVLLEGKELAFEEAGEEQLLSLKGTHISLTLE